MLLVQWNSCFFFKSFFLTTINPCNPYSRKLTRNLPYIEIFNKKIFFLFILIINTCSPRKIDAHKIFNLFAMKYNLFNKKRRLHASPSLTLIYAICVATLFFGCRFLCMHDVSCITASMPACAFTNFNVFVNTNFRVQYVRSLRQISINRGNNSSSGNNSTLSKM